MIIKVIGCGEDKPISVKIKDLQRVDRVIGDYGDLTGKPEINGHELVGNLSTSDLGIQTYVKPADGIPKEDLSEEVQELLERETGKFYMLEADVGAIIYKAGAPIGEIFTPSTITVNAYQVDSSGNRSSVEADVLTYECMTKDGYPIETGSWSGACYATVALPQTDIEAMTVQFGILKLSEYGFLDTVATLKIPVIPAGQDGTIDDSLKALSKSFDIEELQFIEGKRINNSGSTIDVTVFNTNASWKCCVVDCSPGDIFTVSSAGGTTYRAWAFVSSSGQNLMAAESGASCSNLEIIAPDYAAKLVINDTIITGNVCYRGRRLQKTIDCTSSAIGKAFYYKDGYYNLRGLTFNTYWNSNGVKRSASNCYITPLYDISDGILVHVSEISNPVAGGYHVFFNESRSFISSVKAQRGEAYISVPTGAAYVSFSFREDDRTSFTFEALVPKSYNTIPSYPYRFDKFENKKVAEDANPAAGYISSSNFVTSEPVDLMPGDTIVATNGYVFRKIDAATFSMNDSRYYYTATANEASVIFSFTKSDMGDLTPEEVCSKAIAYTNIKFHEKSSLTRYDLNEAAYDSTDMLWSLWFYPQAVSFKKIRDCLYWGFVQSDGSSGIACKNFSTGAITKNILKKFNPNFNSSISVFVKDDGTIICAFPGGSNEDRQIHVRVSEKKENIERFGFDKSLDCNGYVSCCQIVHSGNKYVMFYRLDLSRWAFRLSDDCINWGDERIFVTSSYKWSCLFRPTASDGLIRVIMHKAPGSNSCEIRQGFYDVEHDQILNSDATTVLGTNEVNYSNFSVLIPQDATYRRQRAFDVAITSPSNVRILYCAFTDSSSVYRLYDNGTTYDVCDGGSPLFSSYDSYFWTYIVEDQLGMAFVDDGKFVVARNDSGSDIIELYDYDGESVTLNKTVFSESVDEGDFRNTSPIVDVNGKYFLWGRGYFNHVQCEDYNMDAMIQEI